ncbi:Glutaredoxin [Arthrobacter subterraneus]|uniref:Glutaredoxin n=1 Tax=Arthrobacter subterraneus TaxID=335973 RepID=A0A1G8PT52_9MICC|nr:thioredoxin family protein [Arthrobacter subterraneus]SDI95661.1 Glutaredoxin [Arthrobacter subterraneus]
MPTTVTVLTQDNCAWCEQAKAILQDISATQPLSIEEIELTSEHGRDLAISHGVVFAPGILLDGQLFSYGRPSEKKLRRRLK